ncbi:MAG: hypothetical protein ACOC1O_01465 [bacterium]
MNNTNFIYELQHGTAINLLDVTKIHMMKRNIPGIINSKSFLDELLMKKEDKIYSVSFYFEIEYKDDIIVQRSKNVIFSKYDSEDDIPSPPKDFQKYRVDIIDKWNKALQAKYLKKKNGHFQSTWKNKDE